MRRITLIFCLLTSLALAGCKSNDGAAHVPTWEPTRDDGTPIPDPHGMTNIPSRPTRPL